MARPAPAEPQVRVIFQTAKKFDDYIRSEAAELGLTRSELYRRVLGLGLKAYMRQKKEQQ